MNKRNELTICLFVEFSWRSFDISVKMIKKGIDEERQTKNLFFMVNMLTYLLVVIISNRPSKGEPIL